MITIMMIITNILIDYFKQINKRDITSQALRLIDSIITYFQTKSMINNQPANSKDFV